MKARLQMHDAASLAAGYKKSHRVVEWIGIVAFGVFGSILAIRIGRVIGREWWLLPVGALMGFIAADFVSGFVHWFCDTWGSVDTPIIGKQFIRTFREHHVDQESITRHDFVETNGDNCLVASPLLALSLLLPLAVGATTEIFAGIFLLALTFFVFMTSQIHKWSHMREPPPVIALMQRLHLILPKEHHAKHHSAPFDRHYCITVGWLNVPLQRIGFFRILERVITAVTGVIPRQDDIGTSAALVVAEENGVLPESPGMAPPVVSGEKPRVGLSGP